MAEEDLKPFERFRGRRGLVMGLGVFGGGVESAKFLCNYCESVVVTDLRGEDVLAESVRQLEGLPIEYRLGEHRKKDFIDADVVIHSPAVRPDNQFLQAARDNGAEVTMEMSLFIEACPATTVGITGSNGKTTTALLAYEMLCEVMERAQPELEGNWAEPNQPIATRDGRVWLGGNCGKPLLNELRGMEANDVVVLELSSFQLQDWHRIGASCEIAAITNITANHLDWHKDMKEYVWAKQAIYQYQGDNAYAIFNVFDAQTRKMLRELADEIGVPGPDDEWERFVFGYRGRGTDNGSVPILVDGASGTMFFAEGFGPILQDRGGTVVERSALSLPGEFNWENACAAAALFSACLPGTGSPAVLAALMRFRGVEHRLEYCGEVNGARCYNDSIATTPESTMAALSAFDSGIHLLLGGSDKGLSYAALTKRIADHPGIKAIYLQGDNAEPIRSAIAGAQRATPLQIHGSFDEACEAAFAGLEPGDVFLMSPSSASFYEYAPHKRFTNFEHRGRYFKTLVEAHAIKES